MGSLLQALRSLRIHGYQKSRQSQKAEEGAIALTAVVQYITNRVCRKKRDHYSFSSPILPVDKIEILSKIEIQSCRNSTPAIRGGSRHAPNNFKDHL
jgi:hypothetical protein